jgi:hypothetical protein
MTGKAGGADLLLKTTVCTTQTVVFYAILSFFYDADDRDTAFEICYATHMAAKKPRVIIYGSSVVMSGIAASLGLDPDCEVSGCVMTVDRQVLDALQPDTLVFEKDAISPELLLTLSQEIPGLLLIGIDPQTNRALVWSGQQALGWSSQDLAQIIVHAKFYIPETGRHE